jgi:hypothetical protein
VRELPYSIADVELLEDVEALEALQGAAMNAAMQVRDLGHAAGCLTGWLAGCIVMLTIELDLCMR